VLVLSTACSKDKVIVKTLMFNKILPYFKTEMHFIRHFLRKMELYPKYCRKRRVEAKLLQTLTYAILSSGIQKNEFIEVK